MLAKFCVMTRLKEHENSNLTSKMRVYDGEKLKDTDPKAKTLQEYKDAAGVDEGMTLGRTADAVGPMEPGVEPLRRVRRGHLVDEHVFQLVLEGFGVGTGGEHLSRLLTVGDPAHSHDGQSREGRPALVDRPDRHRVDRGTG